MRGIKIPQQDFALKWRGGGGGEERICGTLRTPSFEGLLLKILCANVLRALRTHWSYVTRVSTQ